MAMADTRQLLSFIGLCLLGWVGLSVYSAVLNANVASGEAKRQTHAGTLSCRTGPQESVDYGFVVDHRIIDPRDQSPRNQITVIAVPNSARHPAHYEDDCRPRTLSPAGRWLVDSHLPAAAVPALTLAFDGRFVRGVPGGALPRLMPGEPVPPDRLLIFIRNVPRRQVIRGLIDAAGAATDPAHRFHAGRLSDQERTIAECDAAGLCRMLAQLDYDMPGTSLAGPLSDLTIEIWLNEALLPKAPAIMAQVVQLLKSVSTTRLWTG